MANVVSREEARAAGLKHYATGKPCKRGHVSERLVSNRCCVQCVQEKAITPTSREKQRASSAAWYKANREKKQTYCAAWYQDNRERCLETSAAWHKTHPEKTAAISARWREANPEYIPTWRRANPENRTAWWANQAARKYGAEGKITGQQIKDLAMQQDYKCAYCSDEITPKTWQGDHYVPLSSGGSNWIENIRLACGPCNLRKRAKFPEVWEEELIDAVKQILDRRAPAPPATTQ